ncbi:MAG: helix-turn-helix transcriptional regulator [Lachnospiraceae bacterium]|nr:helix-turn-helix transcriptional regulator [Lachnospiraceae bacterium]
MIISERIFKIMKEKKMTQMEFAKRVGIANSTVSEWKKRKTNPSADKIMDICEVLEITPEQLLTGKGIDDVDDIGTAPQEKLITPTDRKIIDDYHRMKEEQKKRFIAYMEALKKLEELENNL